MRWAAVVWLVAVALAGAALAQDGEPPAAAAEAQGNEGEGEQPPAAESPAPEAPPAAGATPEAAPPASDDTLFGSAHQATFSDDVRLSATRLSASGQSGGLTTIRLTPAFDFFPVTNVSVGGQVAIGYLSQDSGDSTSSSIELGLFARVGLNVPISATSSVWPRVALGVMHYGGRLGGSSDYVHTTVPFQVYVPFVFQPAAHFFFGVGPILTTDLVAKENGDDATRMTTVGVQSTLGGYFRGK